MHEERLTNSCRSLVSFSGVMRVLWIRNLSLHLVDKGGSSFIGCSITIEDVSKVEHGLNTRHIPETSTLSPGSILPEFGRTQYNYGIYKPQEHPPLYLSAHLGRSGLDFECYRLSIFVRDSQDLLDELRKRS